MVAEEHKEGMMTQDDYVKSTEKCSLVTLLHSHYIRNVNLAVNKELPVLNTCIKSV